MGIIIETDRRNVRLEATDKIQMEELLVIKTSVVFINRFQESKFPVPTHNPMQCNWAVSNQSLKPVKYQMDSFSRRYEHLKSEKVLNLSTQLV